MGIMRNVKGTPREAINAIRDVPLNLLDITKLPKIAPTVSKEKLGKAPGTVIYSGKLRTEKVKIHIMDYTKLKVNEFSKHA